MASSTAHFPGLTSRLYALIVRIIRHPHLQRFLHALIMTHFRSFFYLPEFYSLFLFFILHGKGELDPFVSQSVLHHISVPDTPGPLAHTLRSLVYVSDSLHVGDSHLPTKAQHFWLFQVN